MALACVRSGLCFNAGELWWLVLEERRKEEEIWDVNFSNSKKRGLGVGERFSLFFSRFFFLAENDRSCSLRSNNSKNISRIAVLHA